MILRLNTRSPAYRRDIDDMPVLLADGTLVDDDGGTALWPALEMGATYDELVDRVREEFDLDRHSAAINTDRFMSHLRRRGLLVES